jgi:acyl-CoA reductase-like NAD-dependent aldehyde dehydrogenase
MSSSTREAIPSSFDLVIGGDHRPAALGTTFELLEPATGEPLATVGEAGPSDIEAALEAATTEFETGQWRRTNATDRGRVLFRVAALLRERAELFALAEARIPVQDPGIDMAVREPVGVCALVVPWNFPLLIATWKIAPALACGNPVIVKPASLTPLTALMLADVLLDAGVPPAAVSVVPGPGRTVGQQLISDPRVAKISFTGETATGVGIMRSSAHNIARVSLELGGKSACVVFDDADLERAIDSTPMLVFDNTGQDCCARSRFLVQRGVYEEFVSGFVDRTADLVVGDPLEESTQLGPMISEGQRQVSLDYLSIAAQEGATQVCGGDVTGPGWYLSPSVLTGVDNDMRVAQEEIFGPVAAMIPFDTEDEAIQLANASPYGLSGTVWTGNLGRAVRVTRAIRTGVISVNSGRSVRTEAPFGGFKHSGVGRALGMAAMDDYTEVKNIFFSDE